MFGFFRKVFGPIGSVVQESIPFQGQPDWQRLNDQFVSVYMPGFLPSKKITKPKGKISDDGCVFTMNYLNMAMVMPSVEMRQTESGNIEVSYFYKSPWKWAQYYWMGFSTLFFGIGLIMVLAIIAGIFFNEGSDGASENLAQASMGLIFPLMGLAFIWFASYFRKDLLKKAKIKVSDYINILSESEMF